MDDGRPCILVRPTFLCWLLGKRIPITQDYIKAELLKIQIKD